ncbi:hypothetical protein E2C01_036806 [Portunus trituberculatus]|uniref:Uncharacterized protein n=1 Tax=Portunus trituberculatus TaxID=210409 RepID=A0A5B7FD27_PORTR|nr:hypothetical protein [Portunus trituberculatus]
MSPACGKFVDPAFSGSDGWKLSADQVCSASMSVSLRRYEASGVGQGERTSPHLASPRLASEKGHSCRSMFVPPFWNHACFGVRGVSKRTGSNPVHGLSVGWAFSFRALAGGL